MNKNLTLECGDVVDGNYQVVKFVGDFDKAGHADIRDELADCVSKFEAKTLVFDFQNLQFINSEGIGALVEIHTHLVQKGKKLVVIAPNEHVADVFQAVGLKEIVPIFASMNAFLNS